MHNRTGYRIIYMTVSLIMWTLKTSAHTRFTSRSTAIRNGFEFIQSMKYYSSGMQVVSILLASIHASCGPASRSFIGLCFVKCDTKVKGRTL
jgi:hypothetical protein